MVLVLSLVFGGGVWYVSDYYPADTAAIAAFTAELTVPEKQSDGMIAFGTGEEETALIFYPGGKVEYTAYAPLMAALAEKGIFCIAVKMPCNLAVLDIHAAKKVRERYPEIDDWYIGGHSLGGSMAASHLGQYADDYRGLILLGAYSTEDLSETNLNVLSIYGTEDTVLNREKYEQYRPDLPSGFSEQVIEGGCHAYFGMYGKQAGDGIPTLTAKEQIMLTADIIDAFIREEGR